MKNELDNMEKQLHLAINQTVELEDKLQKIISQKSNLLSEKERENAKKSAELSQLNEQLAKISELEKSHQVKSVISIFSKTSWKYADNKEIISN